MIKLKGISQKGKNRIHEQGEDWEIVREQERVPFSMETGPWLLLSSGNNLRWIHKTNDKDFEIV